MQKILKNFYKNNFVFLGKEKLSKLSILAIIFLDIVVLMIIYQGISFQTSVVTTPSTKFPYECRDILSNSSLEDFNSYIYLDYRYDSKYQEIKNLEIDTRCNVLYQKIAQIQKDINIEDYKNKDTQNYEKERKLKDEMNYLKANYNTILFEQISNQKSDDSIIEGNLTAKNIKEKYKNLNSELDNIIKNKENLLTQFKNEKLIKDLILYLEENKSQILNDITKSEKYYYIKHELIILVFLFPLVGLFFYLMKRNLSNEKYVPYIIFKNILLVSLIPTIQSIYYLVDIFIPKIFVEKLLMFFYTLDIPFIVYYFVIAIFVFIFIFIIIKLQNRFREENEKLKNNNISFIEAYNKNICSNCKNRVDYIRMNYCPSCQKQLKIKCETCNSSTILGLKFCNNCGKDLIITNS